MFELKGQFCELRSLSTVMVTIALCHDCSTYKPAHIRLWDLGGDWVCIGVPAKRGNSEHNGHSQKRR